MTAGYTIGINLTALSATYAVATTPGWDPTPVEERQARIIAVLEKCVAATIIEGSPDKASVEETITAIKNGAINFTPRFPETMEQEIYRLINGIEPEDGVDKLSSNNASDVSVALDRREIITRNEVQSLVSNAVQLAITNLDQRTSQPGLSPMDLITIKHGYEIVSRDVISLERIVSERITHVEKRLDDRITDMRSTRQERIGTAQVDVGKWAIIISTMISLIAIGLTVYVAFFAS